MEVLMKRPHDESVDIYSLGTCLYYMLSGSFPFCGDKTSYEELCNNVVSENMVFPERMSSSAQDLLRRMLTSRHRRISCDEIRHHLWLNDHVK